MKRKNRSFLTAAGLLIMLGGLIACNSEDEKPNIIFLLTDDQRYDALGCMGNDEIQTPNIDALAEDGLLFTNHYNTTAICMASRATIMTGMYEYKSGCNFQHGPLIQERFEQSYPVLLRNAGYRTGFAGKFGYAVIQPDMKDNSSYHTMDRLPVDQFDWWRGWPGQGYYETEKNEYMVEYAEEYPHVSRALGAAAVDFIRESSEMNQPFCLSLSFKAPHSPVRPDPEFDHVYADKKFTKPANYGLAGAEHLPEHPKTDRQYQKLFKRWEGDNFDGALADYYQQIYGVDQAVGMILDELKKLGIDDNTIVIFTTDNGYFTGSHAFGGKVLPYEEGSRSPLIIYDPSSKTAGEQLVSHSLTGGIDMAPTILEMAGLPIPEEMDGVSLIPVLNDPEFEVKEHQAFIQAWGNPAAQSMSVIWKNYKYIYWYYAEGMDAAEELYHLDKDNNEMNNLAAVPEMISTLEKMRSVYDEHLTKWKEEYKEGSNYDKYGVLFDRNIAWEDKKEFATKNNN